MTGAAAIDGTGTAKATVITGIGTNNLLTGFAGINTLIGGGNDTLGSARHWFGSGCQGRFLPTDASARHIRGTYSAWMPMCSRSG